MRGKIIGFGKEPCDPAKDRHSFRGSVCDCGRIRLIGRTVAPDMTVKAERTGT